LKLSVPHTPTVSPCARSASIQRRSTVSSVGSSSTCIATHVKCAAWSHVPSVSGSGKSCGLSMNTPAPEKTSLGALARATEVVAKSPAARTAITPARTTIARSGL
jgi:hypothetical protein